MEMIQIRDHLNRNLNVPSQAERIVSLCPSQTETLVALGVGSRLVGRTVFCIHPEPAIRQIPQVGGTKKVNIDRISALAPDLIIGEKEENTPEMVEALSQLAPVYVTDVKDLDSAMEMIADLGTLTNTTNQAEAWIHQIRSAFAAPPVSSQARVAYFIWRDPWMVVGQDTYIDEVLRWCGWVNVFAGYSGRYPQITLDDLIEASPELILLSSEPYPFRQKHLDELASHVPRSQILLVDGEMFSWYGVRMKPAASYLHSLAQSVRD